MSALLGRVRVPWREAGAVTSTICVCRIHKLHVNKGVYVESGHAPDLGFHIGMPCLFWEAPGIYNGGIVEILNVDHNMVPIKQCGRVVFH